MERPHIRQAIDTAPAATRVTPSRLATVRRTPRKTTPGAAPSTTPDYRDLREWPRHFSLKRGEMLGHIIQPGYFETRASSRRWVHELIVLWNVASLCS